MALTPISASEPVNDVIVTSLDTPRTVWNQDTNAQTNISSTGYQVGTPEVGVFFLAPTSGRVLITVGGVHADNTNDNRVFLSPQVLETDMVTEILAPSVDIYGWSTPGSNSTAMGGSRISMLEGLTPGKVYYARVMMSAEITTSASADITAREIIVEPTS